MMQITRLFYQEEDHYSPVISAVSTLATGLQSESGAAAIDAHAASTTPDATDENLATDENAQMLRLHQSQNWNWSSLQRKM